MELQERLLLVAQVVLILVVAAAVALVGGQALEVLVALGLL